MKIFYLVIAIIVLSILAAFHHQKRQINAGMPPGTAKICAPFDSQNCAYVDVKLANVVYSKVQAMANADETQMFPTQASEDFDAKYQLDNATLHEIALTVADDLGISRTQVENHPAIAHIGSINALILFFHNLVQQS